MPIVIIIHAKKKLEKTITVLKYVYNNSLFFNTITYVIDKCYTYILHFQNKLNGFLR